jgi:hypothetical protein
MPVRDLMMEDTVADEDGPAGPLEELLHEHIDRACAALNIAGVEDLYAGAELYPAPEEHRDPEDGSLRLDYRAYDGFTRAQAIRVRCVEHLHWIHMDGAGLDSTLDIRQIDAILFRLRELLPHAAAAEPPEPIALRLKELKASGKP